MEKYSNQKKFENRYREMQHNADASLHNMDISKKTDYILNLSSVLDKKEKEGRRTLDITEPRFMTGPSYALTNLPKLGEGYEGGVYNFYFTEEQQKEMMNTPKVIFATTEYRMKPVPGKLKTGVVHMYMVAPWLKDSELPLIYRMDVLMSPDNTAFSGFAMHALVGGFKDGVCPLSCTLCASKDKNAVYYDVLPGMTKRKLTAGTPHEIEGNPIQIYDVADFMFDHCGIKYYQKYATNYNKIYDITRSFRAKNSDLVIPSELVEATTGGEFISRFFGGRVLVDNHNFTREMTSILDPSSNGGATISSPKSQERF